MEPRGKRAAWHQEIWGQGGGGDGEHRGKTQEAMGRIGKQPLAPAGLGEAEFSHPAEQVTLVLVLGPQETDLAALGREEQVGMCGKAVWKPSTGRLMLQRPGNGTSGLLSFKWVLQMLLVMARRKPVPPQRLPEPYTISFSVGQLPGEGWRVPGSS